MSEETKGSEKERVNLLVSRYPLGCASDVGMIGPTICGGSRMSSLAFDRRVGDTWLHAAAEEVACLSKPGCYRPTPLTDAN